MGDSGTNDHRVIYQAHGYGTGKQEPVVLSGGRKIGGWTKDADAGIWRAEVGDLETRQLYVNGQRAYRASISGDLPEFMFTDDGYVTASTEPLSWANPGDIEFVHTGAAPWAEPRCGVATIAAADGKTTIVMDQPSFRRAIGVFHSDVWPLRGLVPTSIENSKSFLTEPGEFYLDRSAPGEHVLYYIPRPGEDLNEASVVAPVLESLIRGTGTANLPLRNVSSEV